MTSLTKGHGQIIQNMANIKSTVIGKRVKLPDLKKHVIKLSEKTIEKTQKANKFFLAAGDFFLFVFITTRETFSRQFEFRNSSVSVIKLEINLAADFINRANYGFGTYHPIASCFS
ncbi:MAG: hypothetical protein IPF54_14095 [Draconibacterium sp.]|nr:hypothetical protein [Draconibacterium sp.]